MRMRGWGAFVISPVEDGESTEDVREHVRSARDAHVTKSDDRAPTAVSKYCHRKSLAANCGIRLTTLRTLHYICLLLPAHIPSVPLFQRPSSPQQWLHERYRRSESQKQCWARWMRDCDRRMGWVVFSVQDGPRYQFMASTSRSGCARYHSNRRIHLKELDQPCAKHTERVKYTSRSWSTSSSRLQQSAFRPWSWQQSSSTPRHRFQQRVRWSPNKPFLPGEHLIDHFAL